MHIKLPCRSVSSSRVKKKYWSWKWVRFLLCNTYKWAAACLTAGLTVVVFQSRCLPSLDSLQFVHRPPPWSRRRTRWLLVIIRQEQEYIKVRTAGQFSKLTLWVVCVLFRLFFTQLHDLFIFLEIKWFPMKFGIGSL